MWSSKPTCNWGAQDRSFLVSLNKIPFGEHVNHGVRLTLYMLLLKFTKMTTPNDLTMNRRPQRKIAGWWFQPL